MTNKIIINDDDYDKTKNVEKLGLNKLLMCKTVAYFIYELFYAKCEIQTIQTNDKKYRFKIFEN